AAVVLLQSRTGLTAQWAPQTLRGWCNVPVAVMVPSARSNAALRNLATEWAAAGRRLWVGAHDPAAVRGALPAAAPRATPLVLNPYMLERALLHRPGSYSVEQIALVMAPVRTG